MVGIVEILIGVTAVALVGSVAGVCAIAYRTAAARPQHLKDLISGEHLHLLSQKLRTIKQSMRDLVPQNSKSEHSFTTMAGWTFHYTTDEDGAGVSHRIKLSHQAGKVPWIELKWVALVISNCLNIDSEIIEWNEEEQLVTFNLSSSEHERFLQAESKLFERDTKLGVWILQTYERTGKRRDGE